MLGTVLKYTENHTYLLYLLSDTIWTWEFSHRQRPEWDAAHRPLRAASRQGRARAAMPRKSSIVGHSSGSFLGIEILARALKLDPDLGRHGPRIVLLTIGGNFPIVGFHAASQDFRDHLRQLAVEPSIDWIDCQSRKDVMNFYPFDPIAGHGIDVGAAKRNPTIVPVRFREIIKPEHYNLFRWKFFRVHFQFVMANERPHAYDFFMIVCGPVPLERAHGRSRGGAGDRDRRRRGPRNGPGKGSKPPDPAAGCRRTGQNGTVSPGAAVKYGPSATLTAVRGSGPAGWLWPPLWCKGCSSMGC